MSCGGKVPYGQMDLFHRLDPVAFVIVVGLGEGGISFAQQTRGAGGLRLNAVCHGQSQHDGCTQGGETKASGVHGLKMPPAGKLSTPPDRATRSGVIFIP
jgi:hypothetical protein